MTSDWGGCYFDHYERFLRSPAHREVFGLDDSGPSIQILRYGKVFKGCVTYCSIGFSRHVPGEELVCVVDDCWHEVPRILASTLFLFADRGIGIPLGLSQAGLSDISEKFVNDTNKRALYFTAPFPFPEGFVACECGDRRGRVFLGIFISIQEHEYIKNNGSGSFESIMEERGVDPFDVKRPSVIS